MARIRSVKPDFFRHEALQDLEIANPGSYPMMVFAGLWGHCDSRGRFEWRPRQLKLDILPFLPFDMAETLEVLERAGMVKRYSVGGKDYGEVPTFEKHQRLSGKEATEGEKHPEPNREAIGKQPGSAGEIQESQEGKGREEEGKDPLSSTVDPGSPDVPPSDAPPTAAPGKVGSSSSKRGARLADDWFLPKPWGEWAVSEIGLSADQVRVEGEKFADFWHSKPGRDACKLDWEATWRNWARTARERLPSSHPASSSGAGRVFAGAL